MKRKKRLTPIERAEKKLQQAQDGFLIWAKQVGYVAKKLEQCRRNAVIYGRKLEKLRQQEVTAHAVTRKFRLE